MPAKRDQRRRQETMARRRHVAAMMKASRGAAATDLADIHSHTAVQRLYLKVCQAKSKSASDAGVVVADAQVMSSLRTDTLRAALDDFEANDVRALLQLLPHLRRFRGLVVSCDKARPSGQMRKSKKGVYRAEPVIRTPDLAAKLCKALRQTLDGSRTLQTLELPGIRLSPRGCRTLAAGLGASGESPLRKLNLTNCGIGDAGFNALLESLVNCHALHTLVLRQCRLTSAVKGGLADIIKGHSAWRDSQAWAINLRADPGEVLVTDSIAVQGLVALDLSHNQLDRALVATLCRVLIHDEWLRALNLDGNLLGARDLAALQGHLEANATLLVLGVQGVFSPAERALERLDALVTAYEEHGGGGAGGGKPLPRPKRGGPRTHPFVASLAEATGLTHEHVERWWAHRVSVDERRDYIRRLLLAADDRPVFLDEDAEHPRLAAPPRAWPDFLTDDSDLAALVQAWHAEQHGRAPAAAKAAAASARRPVGSPAASPGRADPPAPEPLVLGPRDEKPAADGPASCPRPADDGQQAADDSDVEKDWESEGDEPIEPDAPPPKAVAAALAKVRAAARQRAAGDVAVSLAPQGWRALARHITRLDRRRFAADSAAFRAQLEARALRVHLDEALSAPAAAAPAPAAAASDLLDAVLETLSASGPRVADVDLQQTLGIFAGGVSIEGGPRLQTTDAQADALRALLRDGPLSLVQFVRAAMTDAGVCAAFGVGPARSAEALVEVPTPDDDTLRLLEASVRELSERVAMYESMSASAPPPTPPPAAAADDGAVADAQLLREISSEIEAQLRASWGATT